jgi:hypothetical protein
MKANFNDQDHIRRLHYFRNFQKQDKNFDKKKEKIIWPVFEFTDSPDKNF